MKTLYVTDLDGTLLGSDSLVSGRSASIISDLGRRGALVTVATARTAATVVPLLEHTFTLPPAIVMTGAALWNRGVGYGNVHHLRADQGEIISNVLKYNGLAPFVYFTEGCDKLAVFHSAKALTPAEQEFYNARKDLTLKRFYLSVPIPKGRDSVLWYAMGPGGNVRRAAEELHRASELSVSSYPDIFDPALAHIEVFAAGVSKAASVLQLKELTGAGRVVAFGDNLNDLPMLGVADVAVAVENALPQVKAAAHVVIGPNTADSVAEFIQQDFYRSKRGVDR